MPWIPTQYRPRDDAAIFHVDVDPLKQQMPLFYVEARAQFRADALRSIQQVTAALKSGPAAARLRERDTTLAAARVAREYRERLDAIADKAKPFEDGSFGTGHLARTLRKMCPYDTLWAVEAVTNTGFVHDNLQLTRPGSWINCGGGGLGWSGSGALGIKLATDAESSDKGRFVVQIVGDGTYLFSVPGSVYWVSKRYKIPVLTIVLNNKGEWRARIQLRAAKLTPRAFLGWHAPRRSLLLVHPEGLGSKATDEEANISFDPVPDYAGIAKAAADGHFLAARVSQASELEAVLREAIARVQAGQTAVVDCKVLPGC